MKKLISILLCFALLLAGTVCAFAAAPPVRIVEKNGVFTAVNDTDHHYNIVAIIAAYSSEGRMTDIEMVNGVTELDPRDVFSAVPTISDDTLKMFVVDRETYAPLSGSVPFLYQDTVDSLISQGMDQIDADIDYGYVSSNASGYTVNVSEGDKTLGDLFEDLLSSFADFFGAYSGIVSEIRIGNYSHPVGASVTEEAIREAIAQSGLLAGSASSSTKLSELAGERIVLTACTTDNRSFDYTVKLSPSSAMTEGKSAYQIAVDNGFAGTPAEWLESLIGPAGVPGAQGPAGENGADGKDGLNGKDGSDGKSAYELAVENGYDGTVQEWLASLVGPSGVNGRDGKSAYELACDHGYTGSESEWLSSLAGANGLSAYEIAVKNGFSGSETEWLASLVGPAGPAGADGKSAYEVAVENGFEGSELEWLASLRGEAGEQGNPGETGPAGRGVSSLAFNEDGELVASYTDGTTQNLGTVPQNPARTCRLQFFSSDRDSSTYTTVRLTRASSGEAVFDASLWVGSGQITKMNVGEKLLIYMRNFAPEGGSLSLYCTSQQILDTITKKLCL